MAQVWLVTGSSRGLGRAIVEAGLLAGNKVLATARDIESLRELLDRYGDQVKLFVPPASDRESRVSETKCRLRKAVCLPSSDSRITRTLLACPL
jgi:NADP-dependent 3-hydroxy acid dehydrogenase YdfG